jgi:hypothetical protein
VRREYDRGTLQQILQPVCANDQEPDLVPTYYDSEEQHLMKKARFNVITLSQTKKCYWMMRR